MKTGRTLGLKLGYGLLLASLSTGCGGPPDSIVPTVTEHELTAQEIDADPLALLPGGFVGLLRTEVPPLVQSSLGPSVVALAQRLAPLPLSSGFRPERDLERLYVGLYSMSGADIAGVAVGRFDLGLIQLSASQTVGAVGSSLVASPYAGRTLYTVNNFGFCALTQRIALFGNETGIRRALDRLHEGRAQRRMPAWTDELVDSARAPLAFGVDLRVSPVPEAMRKQLPFTDGMTRGRVLGNFDAPGLHLAGTLGYESEAQATTGAQALLAVRNVFTQYGFLMSLVGIKDPFQQLEARPQGNEATFVATLDGPVLARVLTQVLPMIGVSANGGAGSPVPLTPGVH